MSYTERLSESMCPIVTIMPAATNFAIGTHNTAFVSLANYHRAWLVVTIAEMAAAATVDVGIQQAQDAAGTGVKAITGKTITQLTQAGGDENSIVCIELQTEELDVDGDFEFVRFYLTVAGNTVDGSAILFGCSPRYKPVPTTGWTEIVG
jgi:hypothetical protein